ncbi:hypothetical protein ACRAR1_01460 [Streptomyces sanyensis]
MAESSGGVRDATRLTLGLMKVDKGYQGHQGAWVLFAMKTS